MSTYGTASSMKIGPGPVLVDASPYAAKDRTAITSAPKPAIEVTVARAPSEMRSCRRASAAAIAHWKTP